MKRKQPRSRSRLKHPPKWRESFTVWIDFIGDRSQIGPLLDFIAGVPSDGGGTFLASVPWLSDQSWTFDGRRNRREIYIGVPQEAEARTGAIACYDNLKAACKAHWSPYILLRLFHDDNPERCAYPEPLPDGTWPNPGTPEFRKRGGGPGPLVLRKYQSGKPPKSSIRPRPKHKP